MKQKTNQFESRKKEGNDAFQEGKFDDAINIYTDVLQIDPQNDVLNSTIYNNRAAAYMKLKKFKEAKEDATKSIESDPTNLKAIIRRANCYLSLDQFEEAVRDFEKAHEIDPENRDIDSNLRDAKLKLKKSQRKDYYKILDISEKADEVSCLNLLNDLVLKETKN
jgi:DnaJ family protein C protein 7